MPSLFCAILIVLLFSLLAVRAHRSGRAVRTRPETRAAQDAKTERAPDAKDAP
jgi:hypothetical protein